MLRDIVMEKGRYLALDESLSHDASLSRDKPGLA